MKYIIDIPEDIRVAISQMGLLRIPDEMIRVVDEAIQHSMPLDKYKAESEPQESIEKESIPYLMHKEMGIPISECQKAYDIAIEYLRSQGKLKG